jgi:hypothetical protein
VPGRVQSKRAKHTLHHEQWFLASLLRQKDWHCALGTSFLCEEVHARDAAAPLTAATPVADVWEEAAAAVDTG